MMIVCGSPPYCVYFCLLLMHLSIEPPKQDGSLELGSRYGCTQPAIEVDDDDYAQKMHMCGVEYAIAEWSLTPSTIASVKIGD